MELMYVKALKENDLKVSSLPEDAQVGINEIRKVLAGFDMAERKGRNPTPTAIKKLKAMDKWVYYEILDFVHDTEKNDGNLPIDANNVLKDLDKPAPNPPAPNPPAPNPPAPNPPAPDDKKIEKPDNLQDQIEPIGLIIDAELDALFESGKNDYTIDEIKRKARKTYNEIWDAYEVDDSNGIETSKYSFIENEQKIFILKLK